jgi:hypothetical protein
MVPLTPDSRGLTLGFVRQPVLRADHPRTPVNLPEAVNYGFSTDALAAAPLYRGLFSIAGAG